MASSLLKLLSRGSGCRCLLARQRVFQPSCFITTSKKNKDSVTEMPDASSSVLPRRPIEAVSPPEGPNTAGGRPEVHETVTGLGEKEEVSDQALECPEFVVGCGIGLETP